MDTWRCGMPFFAIFRRSGTQFPNCCAQRGFKSRFYGELVSATAFVPIFDSKSRCLGASNAGFLIESIADKSFHPNWKFNEFGGRILLLSDGFGSISFRFLLPWNQAWTLIDSHKNRSKVRGVVVVVGGW